MTCANTAHPAKQYYYYHHRRLSQIISTLSFPSFHANRNWTPYHGLNLSLSFPFHFTPFHSVPPPVPPLPRALFLISTLTTSSASTKDGARSLLLRIVTEGLEGGGRRSVHTAGMFWDIVWWIGGCLCRDDVCFGFGNGNGRVGRRGRGGWCGGEGWKLLVGRRIGGGEVREGIWVMWEGWVGGCLGMGDGLWRGWEWLRSFYLVNAWLPEMVEWVFLTIVAWKPGAIRGLFITDAV